MNRSLDKLGADLISTALAAAVLGALSAFLAIGLARPAARARRG